MSSYTYIYTIHDGAEKTLLSLSTTPSRQLDLPYTVDEEASNLPPYIPEDHKIFDKELLKRALSFYNIRIETNESYISELKKELAMYENALPNASNVEVYNAIKDDIWTTSSNIKEAVLELKELKRYRWKFVLIKKHMKENKDDLYYYYRD